MSEYFGLDLGTSNCAIASATCEAKPKVLLGTSFYMFTGETSEFRFFQSEPRSADTIGVLLPSTAELEDTACLTAEIQHAPGYSAGEEIPVQLEASVTELGNLELYFVHVPSNKRWKLECGVRLE